MNYTVEARGRVRIIHFAEPEATLNNGADAFREALHDMIKTGQHYLVLDFHEVRYADSTMLEAVLSAFVRLGDTPGDLVVCGLNPILTEAFTLTGINRMIRQFMDVESAITALY